MHISNYNLSITNHSVITFAIMPRAGEDRSLRKLKEQEEGFKQETQNN